MKYLLITGNITFHHFTEEEKILFKTDKEQKALVHEVDSVQLFDDKNRAYKAGDETESYVLFPNFKGELVFESDIERMRTLKSVLSLQQREEIAENLYSALIN